MKGKWVPSFEERHVHLYVVNGVAVGKVVPNRRGDETWAALRLDKSGKRWRVVSKCWMIGDAREDVKAAVCKREAA